jgi:hypothetical protein
VSQNALNMQYPGNRSRSTLGPPLKAKITEKSHKNQTLSIANCM